MFPNAFKGENSSNKLIKVRHIIIAASIKSQFMVWNLYNWVVELIGFTFSLFGFIVLCDIKYFYGLIYVYYKRLFGQAVKIFKKEKFSCVNLRMSTNIYYYFHQAIALIRDLRVYIRRW